MRRSRGVLRCKYPGPSSDLPWRGVALWNHEKNEPKKRTRNCNAFGPQNVAKSIPKSLQQFTKILHFSVFVSVTFSFLILTQFLITFIVPDLRFNCYLHCFREVPHLSRGLENYNKYIQKTIKITPKTYPKPIKNQSKNRR